MNSMNIFEWRQSFGHNNDARVPSHSKSWNFTTIWAVTCAGFSFTVPK